jgi:hypothetical protein
LHSDTFQNSKAWDFFVTESQPIDLVAYMGTYSVFQHVRISKRALRLASKLGLGTTQEGDYKKTSSAGPLPMCPLHMMMPQTTTQTLSSLLAAT